jgi:D-3-phosphoglycerate dehydrogenase
VAKALNIEVFHAGTGNRDAVAEHALGMLLALFNNILKADREVRNGVWDREGNRGVELMNKTVGLIGYGNNGTATAKRLSGFGCKVLAYDKYRDQLWQMNLHRSHRWKQIHGEADILSLHIPLTDKPLSGSMKSLLSGFAKPFYLVNLSRGEIVKLEAVSGGIKAGKY